MCEDELGQDQDKEPFLFDSYQPGELAQIISTQKKVIAAGQAGTRTSRSCGQFLIVIDDFADNPQFSRQERLLHECYTGGGTPRSAPS
jgi:hypothetical protein